MPESGPPQLWNHRLHQRWAGEDLYFWRLAFFPRYDRESVLEAVTGLMAEHKVHSYVIYETLGLFDLFIRAWLPSHASENFKQALTGALKGDSLQLLESFSVTRVLRHHVWEREGSRELEPPESLLKSPWDDPLIERLNREEMDEEQRKQLFKDRILAPLGSSDGVKFFTIITSAVFSIMNTAHDTLEEKLIELLDESSICEPSLYAGSGFGEYIVMGRADPSDFFAITRLSMAINSLGVQDAILVRPYTHVCAHPKPLIRWDRLPLRNLERPYDIDDLLQRSESHTFEVKGSLSHDLERWLNTSEADPVSSDKVINDGVVKAIVGMLNADGGQVVVGALERNDAFNNMSVDEHPKLTQLPRRGQYVCLGVNAEYNDKGWDGFQLRVHELLSSRIQPSPAGLVGVSRETVDGLDICVIGVQPTRANWFYRVLGEKGPVGFFVRDGNRTVSYAGIQADEHKAQRQRG